MNVVQDWLPNLKGKQLINYGSLESLEYWKTEVFENLPPEEAAREKKRDGVTKFNSEYSMRLYQRSVLDVMKAVTAVPKSACTTGSDNQCR